MDIVSTFNPPRMCRLAGETYWVRPLALEDFALLVAWLDDVLPGKADRSMPPLLGSDEAQAALQSLTGQGILAYVGLRQCGLSYAQAVDAWAGADIAEQVRYRDVIFARRRTQKVTGEGEDIAASWWGPHVASMAETFSFTPGELGRLTLDQLEMLATDGLPDEKPGVLTIHEVQAMWEAARARQEANGAAK